MARAPDGRGYWLVSADGGVFAFGDAPFEGGGGRVSLPFRIAAILATPSGRGYWLVGDEGSVLTYGDAQFFGSTGNIPLRSPIVAAAATPSGQGYWLVAAEPPEPSVSHARSGSRRRIRKPGAQSSCVRVEARPSQLPYRAQQCRPQERDHNEHDGCDHERPLDA